MRYRSLVRQTLHYFSRPHEGEPTGPLVGPSAWRVSQLSESDWREAFTASDVAEIEAALDRALAGGKPRAALEKADFPLPRLRHKIDRWRRTLRDGLGFVVLRGLPVEGWSEERAETFFWCFGRHLGVCGAQNPDGDLLGHVRDQRVGVDDVTIRAYRTRQEIRFHCDAADVVGLLCLKTAKHGGRSRIASSVSVYNTLREREPTLAALLFEPTFFDTKAEGGLRFFPIRPSAYADGVLRTFYHSDYFREVERHPDAPRLSSRQRELFDAYDAIATDAEHCLEMDFRPGDIQLLSNHTIVHARGAYEDHEALEDRRHLLRLWLSLPSTTDLRTRLLTEKARVSLVASLVRQRVGQAVLGSSHHE